MPIRRIQSVEVECDCNDCKNNPIGPENNIFDDEEAAYENGWTSFNNGTLWLSGYCEEKNLQK